MLLGLESESAPDETKMSEKDHFSPVYLIITARDMILELLDDYSLAQLARVSWTIHPTAQWELQRREVVSVQVRFFSPKPSYKTFHNGIFGIRSLSPSRRIPPLVTFALQIERLSFLYRKEFFKQWLEIYRNSKLSSATLCRIANFIEKPQSAHHLLRLVIQEGILNHQDLCGWVYPGEQGQSELFRRIVCERICDFVNSEHPKIEDMKDIKEWIFTILPGQGTSLTRPVKKEHLRGRDYEKERDWLDCAIVLSNTLDLDIYDLRTLDECRLAIHICLAGGRYPSDEDTSLMPFRSNIDVMVRDVVEHWEETSDNLRDIARARLPNFTQTIDLGQLVFRLASDSDKETIPDHIMSLINLNSEIINTEDKEGRTALHAAILAQKPLLVQFLLENGANPAALTHDGRSPLGIAARLENCFYARLILERMRDKSVARQLVKDVTRQLLPEDISPASMELLISFL